MILSKLHGGDDFSAYAPAIRRALTYLRETDAMALALGRHELEPEGAMFVNVMDMTTHAYAGSHPEVHRRYIDLFYWPEGGERIGWAPFLGTEPVHLANPESDIWLLEDAVDERILTAHAGDFALFFPWDAHRPGLYLEDAAATSRKLVVKIALELVTDHK